MENIIQQLDKYYALGQYETGYQFLLEQLHKAMEMEDDLLVLGILSELMGYYRVHAMFELGNTMASKAISIIQSRQLENTVIAGTTYLNIATLYRIQGMYEQAHTYFEKCKAIYEEKLEELDSRVISFDNNYSLYYQSIGKTKEAMEYALKAYQHIQKLEDSYEEQAISASNIANMYLQTNDLVQAKKYIDIALDLFQEHAPSDPHRFGAMHALAQYHTLQENNKEAVSMYEVVLASIEETYGKNSDYDIVYKNYQYALKQAQKPIQGLTLSRKFYQQIGKELFETKHKDIIDSLAFGLIGMGSECLGYDDEYSRDHDFGPGFVVFVPQQIYNVHKDALEKTYASLPKEFLGVQRIETKQGQGRVGIVCLEHFFLQFLGRMPSSITDWFMYPSQSLLVVTSGEVFDDHLGELTRRRELLKQYPRDVRLKKIVRALSKMAQSGQYNYPRCLKRQDSIASELALYEFLQQTLDCLCLLNNRYTPYYKWTYHALKQNGKDNAILELVEQLVNNKEDKTVIIESICMHIVTLLQQQKLTTRKDAFLQDHLEEVMSHMEDATIKAMHVMEG